METELPNISVDVGRWAGARYWTWEEAEYLLVGLDHWKISRISPDVPLDLKRTERAKVRECLEFHFRLEDGPKRVRPLEVIEIALRAGLAPPKDLSDAVREIEGSVKDTSVANPVENPGLARKYNKLLKVFLAVAVRRYGFKPDLRRQEAIASIREDAEQLGIKVDDDTIRQRLRDALEQLEPEEEEGVSLATQER